MTARSPFVVWFKDVDRDDVATVGGKGANLGEMTQAKFPVPNGFIVTAQAYFAFIKENSLETKIKHLLNTADFNRSDSLDQVSKHIKKMIIDCSMSDALTKEILTAYKSLGGIFKDALVAVRSSATAEDLPGASFAGQQETYLNVRGDANVLIKIKEAWASLFNARAIFYRHERNFDHFRVGIAIPVQKMIESEKSGIMFTLDPVTNDKSKIVIEAIYGLGEMIVQGIVTPDHYEVSKKDLSIIKKHVSLQEVLLKKAGVDNKEVHVSKHGGMKQKITDVEIKELAALGRKLEHHYFFPQDSEWAIEKGKVYLVQTRPVTTVKTETNKQQVTAQQIEVKEQNALTAEHLSLLLTGDPASPGIATGHVRVIQSANEIYKVESGDILVAPQTNPDFVPAMKKARAIVTDNGGRTCFGESTKILTNAGFLTMKEMHDRFSTGENFSVLSYDHTIGKPRWKKIISTQKNRLHGIRVTVSQSGRMKNNTIDVTPDHKFFTYENRVLIKKPLQNILNRSEAICLLDYVPKTTASLAVSDKLAYLLGAIATDGNIYLKYGVKNWRGGTVTFTQKQTEDKSDFIQTVNTYFNDIYHTQMIPRDKTSHSYIEGRLITGFATDYRAYSLSTALEMKQLLDDLSLLAPAFSESNALHFLAGVLDGDGSFCKNRIQLYVSKKNVLEGILISCLRLGILPQVTTNRTIYNVQILERMNDILQYSKKIKVSASKKELGTKLFAAKQLFGDISNEVNYKGRIKPYVNNNLLIDHRKIKKFILPLVSPEHKKELKAVLTSSLRMQRINIVKDLNEIDVYNLEVAADTELDHNYIVFTERYSPLLVSNSHAAIVSRELGIPAVVGTKTATHILKTGMVVTVNGIKGEIYKGGTIVSPDVHLKALEQVPVSHLKTKTHVYVNLAEPELADRIAQKNVDGVGLLRAEFMMAGIGTHPKKLIHDGKKHIFIQQLAEGIEKFCKPFYPRPVVYRTSDFKTNEYRNLIGGKEYEPIEPNPMLGYRGAFRYVHDPEVFNLELEAIKYVRNQKGMHNLQVMIPFVRSVNELVQVKHLITEAGLHRSQSFKLWMMVEIPVNVILLEKFIFAGIDGISIGSNDLTMLVLGTDRDNNEVATAYDEQSEAVLWALEYVIKTAKKHGVTASICGQAPSQYPQLLEKLVNWGVTSVSIAPDVIESTRSTIAEIEKGLAR